MLQVSESLGQHHKVKAAMLHVVPEYDESGDEAVAASARAGTPPPVVSTSTDPLPIPRARQAFVPGASARSSADGAEGGVLGSHHLPMPSTNSPSINPAAHYAAARWSASLAYDEILLQ